MPPREKIRDILFYKHPCVSVHLSANLPEIVAKFYVEIHVKEKKRDCSRKKSNAFLNCCHSIILEYGLA